jgi:ADP-heptose:LPS heptosyltransferase
VLRPDHWWGALALALARVPARVGYNLPELGPLLTCALPPPGREHAVVTGLRLVGGSAAAERACPGTPPTRFVVSPPDRLAAARLLEEAGLPAGPYAVLHPGASSPVKRWPADRWAVVADRLAERGTAVVLAAGPGEEGELDAIVSRAGRAHHRLARALSLGELGALLAGASLALGADSAPMHLATAVGVPTLRNIGPGDETLFGPWGDPSRHRAVRAVGTWPDPDWFGRGGGPHSTLLALAVEPVLAELAALQP